MIWKKKSKSQMINKYAWYTKRNINLRKRCTETNYERLGKKAFGLHQK